MNKDLTVKLKQGKLRYYYLVVAKNGEIIGNSQRYFSKSNARRAAKQFAEKLGSKYKEVR